MVAGPGGELLLNKHGGAHHERRDVVRVGHGKVGQPESVRKGQMGDEGGVPQFNGVDQPLIQADEHRNLD